MGSMLSNLDYLEIDVVMEIMGTWVSGWHDFESRLPNNQMCALNKALSLCSHLSSGDSNTA